ncbi:MAG: EVE domain-containing protein [Planctomycetota bacterium]|nr:MAG: EVE domain-containing protein [Planctomycetota bacterium]
MKWLFKTEPTDYSFERLAKDKKTVWTGVKNALALQHLRKVKKGDEIAIYHTGSEKSVVGIARATADAKGDAVEVAPVRAVTPLSLPAIKADPRFKDFPLVTFGRLSVMPVPDALWKPLTGEK